ncbi:hypothetical protein H5410_014368 [Solanum commersonii]|uniref:Uncharacterized protein n=1 Tax=Solanum commersonii TaxID=4109 RepID=A0A9J5ZQU3_SOLCO|nr:hypothetical protein H5410_014368 [Solanum commersonii]
MARGRKKKEVPKLMVTPGRMELTDLGSQTQMDDTAGEKSMEQWPPLPSMEMPTKPIEATQLEQNGDTESQGEISSNQGNDKQDLKEVEPGKNG